MTTLMLPVETLLALAGGRVERWPAGSDAPEGFYRIATLQAADAACIAFLANPRYRAQLGTTRAGCVLVSDAALPLTSTEAPGAVIVAVPDAYRAYAQLSQWWAANTRPPAAPGIHRSALVEEGASIHPQACIDAFARIGPGAVVAAGAHIGSYSLVGAGATVGRGSRLAARVTVLDGCHVGARCLLHSGVVIGADGFGFAPSAEGWVKIEQLGGVRIGDDVEIGANTCIDRGALDDTVIEDGVKLDNLIQVGHNVRIGAGSAMAGCVGIAGSAIIGKRCTVGGGAIILGHLELVDDVHISAATVVSRSIRKPGLYSGVYPFDDNAAWEKNAATLRQLHHLRDRLRRLERGGAPQP